MELKEYLYEIKSFSGEGPLRSGVIALKPGCPVYSGHFRGMPITPGACLARIAEELISDSLPDLTLSQVKDIRFLSVIVPGRANEIIYEFSVSEAPQDRKRVDFSFARDGEVCAKMIFIYE